MRAVSKNDHNNSKRHPERREGSRHVEARQNSRCFADAQHDCVGGAKIAVRLLLAVFVTTWSFADAPERLPEVDALFEKWDALESPGASVAIARDGKMFYANGYGSADLEQSAPINADTIFHVASVSKQFTAFAILLLEADGKLSLEDEIQTHLPELADFGVPVRIQHLIHHTSGMRDQWALLGMAGWRWDDVMNMDDIWELAVRQRELNFTPGERHVYSNMGYTLLAFIVERVSGKALPEFCKERIFDPLGMDRTHFHIDHTHLVPGRAYSYGKAGDGYRKDVLNYANVGATSLFTTAPDLLKWLDNYYTGKVGGQALIDRMTTRGVLNSGQTITYATGVSVRNFRGLKNISHGGADAGFRSTVMTFPDHHLSIAVLSNLASFSPGGIAGSIAEIYLKDEMDSTQPEAGTPPDAVTLKAFALSPLRGTYVNPLNGAQVNLVTRRKRLHVILPGAGASPLYARSETEFATLKNPAELTLRFHLDANGDGETLDLSIPGSPLATYRKAAPTPKTPVYLQQFTERYYSPELDVIWEIVPDDDRIALKRRKFKQSRMQSSFADGFASGSYRMVFTRDFDGRVDTMRISTGRVHNLKFERLD